MLLIKDYSTGKYYKTKYDIRDDKLCHLHSIPFVKGGVLSEEECRSERKCLDKFAHIHVVGRFDGRRSGWMRECPWFTWLVVIK